MSAQGPQKGDAGTEQGGAAAADVGLPGYAGACLIWGDLYPLYRPADGGGVRPALGQCEYGGAAVPGLRDPEPAAQPR